MSHMELNTFLLCVHWPGRPYTILRVPVTSTAQDVVVQVLLKARHMDQPNEYVLVEELAIEAALAPVQAPTPTVPGPADKCSTPPPSGMLAAFKSRIRASAQRQVSHDAVAMSSTPCRSMTGSIDLSHMGSQSAKTSAGDSVQIKYSNESTTTPTTIADPSNVSLHSHIIHHTRPLCRRRVLKSDEIVYTVQSRWAAPGRFELQNRREIVTIAVDKVRRWRQAMHALAEAREKQ